MTYYHGTSSVHLSSINEVGLIAGTNLTETRDKNTDVVFLTTSYESALGYAGRSKKQQGGERVILKVQGEYKPWKNKPGCTIFTTSKVDAEKIMDIVYPD